jgi:hypothetical protein
MSSGEFNTPSIFWRSSPPGIDLLALILPNPNHPLAPVALQTWLAALPNGYLENVASMPLAGLAVLVIAWSAGWRPSKWWFGLAIMFGLLALGPFVHVAGANTYVPGPWALLRYVPLIGLAHTPARFAVLLMLALAVMFAAAAMATVAISVLLTAPADLAFAAAQGDSSRLWRALLSAIADALSALLQYL